MSNGVTGATAGASMKYNGLSAPLPGPALGGAVNLNVALPLSWTNAGLPFVSKSWIQWYVCQPVGVASENVPKTCVVWFNVPTPLVTRLSEHPLNAPAPAAIRAHTLKDPAGYVRE